MGAGASCAPVRTTGAWKRNPVLIRLWRASHPVGHRSRRILAEGERGPLGVGDIAQEHFPRPPRIHNQDGSMFGWHILDPFYGMICTPPTIVDHCAILVP